MDCIYAIQSDLLEVLLTLSVLPLNPTILADSVGFFHFMCRILCLFILLIEFNMFLKLKF